MDFWQIVSMSLSIVILKLLLLVRALTAEKRAVTIMKPAFTLPPKRWRILGPWSIHSYPTLKAVIGQRFRPDGLSLCPMKPGRVD